MKLTKFIASFAFFYSFIFVSFAQTTAEKVTIQQSMGLGIFKIIYKTIKPEDVKVNILNDKGESLYKETIYKTLSFSRPYNFADQGAGSYTFVVEDKDGKSETKILYATTNVESSIEVSKIANAPNKYLLSVENKEADQILVRILDNAKTVLYEEVIMVNGKFAVVYNLSRFKTAITFEVSGSNSVLKTFNFQ